MMDTRIARGMNIDAVILSALLTIGSIIQDCEDSLTNWVESRAMIRPRLSQRGVRPRRTGGRASRVRQPINLSDQDRPLHDDDGWVPADEHERKMTGRSSIILNRDDDDDYEDITDDERHVPRTRRSLDDERHYKNGAADSRGRRETDNLVADE